MSIRSQNGSRDRVLASHRKVRVSHLFGSRVMTSLVTQAAHPEDPSTKQPRSMTRVEAWSNSPSLMSPSNDSNGPMNGGTRIPTQGTAYIVQTTGIGTPDALVPMWVV